MMVVN